MATRMQQRRGTAAEWAAANPVLADGEIGFERDTRLFKIGDGVTAYNALVAGFIPPSLVDAKGDLLVGSADNTLARLARGTTGQVLSVASDGSLVWTAPSVDIPASIEDVKGDLIVGTGADTFARLPVGVDGTIPVADSTQATGIKWGPSVYGKTWVWNHGDQLGNNTNGSINLLGTFTVPVASHIIVRGTTMLRLVSAGPAGANIGLQFGLDAAFASGFGPNPPPYVYVGYGLTVTSLWEADVTAGQHSLYVRNGATACNGQAIAISESSGALIELYVVKALPA